MGVLFVGTLITYFFTRRHIQKMRNLASISSAPAKKVVENYIPQE